MTEPACTPTDALPVEAFLGALVYNLVNLGLEVTTHRAPGGAGDDVLKLSAARRGLRVSRRYLPLQLSRLRSPSYAGVCEAGKLLALLERHENR